MGGSACSTADIAVLVTAMVIGMCTELGDDFCFGCTAGGAGDGLLTGFFTGSLFDYVTIIPCVLYSFDLLTNRTGALVRTAVDLSPCAVAMGVGF